MTTHTIITGNSNDMSAVKDCSVDLIVTSPPYPMVEMWDAVFAKQNEYISEISEALEKEDGRGAFLIMHRVLDEVWSECDRVLKEGGFTCINIGDATRTLNGNFELYPNHARIITKFAQMGYSVLPDIHWRKQTNAPNKYMGSGMYPAGAYVTYEHEYILIFRKGGKRVFSEDEKKRRRESAYFWEERNVWFSDLWDIKGMAQKIKAEHDNTRERSASFPLEIPYRLVNMYSMKGDVVLDPFAGLGTTNLACMLSNRNSLGIDIDDRISSLALKNLTRDTNSLNRLIDERLQKHLAFIDTLPEEKLKSCYENINHGFLVKTKQETNIKVDMLSSMKHCENMILCEYV